MSVWEGAVAGFQQDRREAEKRNYDQRIRQQENEGKIALTLLSSDDPEVQHAGLSILAQANQQPKKKGGIRGYLGEYEEGDGLRPILDLANRFQAMADMGSMGSMGAPPPPGSAGLPPASPVEPKAQGAGAVQPPMAGSPMAAAAGGGMDPTTGIDETMMHGMMAPQFGGVPLSSPQTMAGDLSMTPSGQVNMGQVAARVSRDRSIARPGERQRLFWPNATQQQGARRRAELMAEAEVYQQLGATPQQILQTIMASRGNVQSAMGLTNSDPMKLPSGEIVETFIQRDPARGTVGIVYPGGPNGELVPVPPGAQAVLRGTAAGGASMTTYMTGKQLNEAGIVDAGEYPPDDKLYKVQQKGDNIFVLPYTAAGAGGGFQFSGVGTDPRTRQPLVQDRTGNIMPTPGTSPAMSNPTVVAAVQLMTQANKGIAGVAMPEMISEIITQMRPQFPVLNGLSEAQIRALAGLSLTATEADVQRALQSATHTPQPRLPQPPTTAKPPGQPLSMTQPPGATSAPAAGWAKEMVDEILRGRNAQPQPGAVQGRPPR